MKRALAAALIVSASAVPSGAHALARKKKPDLSLDSVARYYEEKSAGMIRLNPALDARSRSLRFTYDNERFPYVIRTSTPLDVHVNQNLFVFDPLAYARQSGARDVLEARRAHYAELDFSVPHQRHAQRYYHLEGWDQLFHPPVKTLEGPLPAYWAALPEIDPANDPALDSHPYFDPAFQERVDRRSNTELTAGNSVTLYANGDSYRPKLDLVERARERIFVSIMFFACDDTSDRLSDALIRKAREGVDVRVITERIYRESLGRRCIDRMRAGGVKVAVSSTSVRKATRASAMHQKIWIRDGVEAIIGGENILDYENEGTGFNYMNRDADARFTGPVVTDLEAEFLHKWSKHATHDAAESTRKSTRDLLAANRRAMERERAQGLRGREHYARWLGDRSTRMKGLCRAASQEARASRQPIAPILEEHLREARSHVILTTPDLIFNPYAPENADKQDTHINRVMRLLYERKGAEHPKVTVITNGEGGGAGEVSIYFQHRYMEHFENDNGILGRINKQIRDYTARRAAAANRAHSLRLQTNPNVDVWHYFQYMHAKLFHFDRVASVVSSWNLDHQSGDINHEVAVLCMDESLRRSLEHDLTRDLMNSVPVVSRNGK